MRKQPILETVSAEAFSNRKRALGPVERIEQVEDGALRIMRYWGANGSLLGETRIDTRSGRASYLLRHHPLADLATYGLKRRGG